MLRAIFLLLAMSWTAAHAVDFSQAAWELDGDDHGVKVYRWTPPGSDLFAFRVEGEIDTTVPKLVQVLTDTEHRTAWAPALTETYVVRWISPVERIEYNRVRTPWPIRDRDFVIQGKAEFDGQGGVELRFHSIQDETIGDKGPVRGEAYDSTYKLTPIDDRKRTKLEYRMLIDPKGSLPRFIVNMYQSRFPKNLMLALQRQAHRTDLKDYAMPVGSGWDATAKP
jgi:hypothetical protein